MRSFCLRAGSDHPALSRDLAASKGFYLRAIECNALASAPYTGLGMVAQIEGELNLCIQRYHQV
jgi:hypothetical protein